MIGLIYKMFQDSFRKSHPNHDDWSSAINASACSRRSWLSVNGLVQYIGRKTAAPHIEYIVHFPTCISFYRRLSCMLCAWTAVPHKLDVAVRHRMLAAGHILANSRSMEPYHVTLVHVPCALIYIVNILQYRLTWRILWKRFYIW